MATISPDLFSLSSIATEFFNGIATEFGLFSVFCLGFFLFRLDLFGDFFGTKKPGKGDPSAAKKLGTEPCEQEVLAQRQSVEAACKGRNSQSILDNYASLERLEPESMLQIVQAFAAADRMREVALFVQDALNKHEALVRGLDTVLGPILEAVTPDPVALRDVWAALCDFKEVLDAPDRDAYLAVIRGYAKHRQLHHRLPELLRQINQRFSFSGADFCALVQRALEDGEAEPAIILALEAVRSATGPKEAELVGQTLPGVCRAAIARAGARGARRCLELLGESFKRQQLCPGDALATILEHATSTEDRELLRSVDRWAEERQVSFGYATVDQLIRTYVRLDKQDKAHGRGCARALELLNEHAVPKGPYDPGEGTTVTLLGLCALAAPQSQPLVEALLELAVSRGKAGLPIYTSAMKAHVAARAPGRACQIYEEQVLKDKSLEPDAMMYGLLIRAAVDAERFELARELFAKSNQKDLINYMSLMKACAKEKDANGALNILKELEESTLTLDTSAYNCALDACVACGELEAARTLFQRMSERGADGGLDVISYNTMLKGLVADASLCGEAEALMEEMRAKGFKPNAVTYNSLLNASFTRGGSMEAAWKLVDSMEAQKVAPDSFTCSILIKGLKNTSRREDVDRALQLVERRDVKDDEILLSTLLEACVRLKDARRVTQVVQRVERGWSMNNNKRGDGSRGEREGPAPPPLSTHTCGALIKAYGFLRQLDQAWQVWEDLRRVHRAEVNETAYSSIIEACVTNGAVHDAVRIFGEMKAKMPAKCKSGIFYGLLIKGFAQRKECHRAMQLYQEMRREEIPVNLVTFNTLIDGCARVGDMEQAAGLFTEMCTMEVEPDLITYSTVIKGYCVQGDLDQAIQLFSMMRRKGIQSDAILFNSILDGCAKRQMRTLAENVLRDMTDSGIAPSNVTLSILVKLYGRCRDLGRAFELVEELSEQNGLQVNSHVYTCLMSACVANNQLDRAIQVFREMQQKGCVPDAKTYQTMLNGCLRHGDMRLAAELVSAALEQSRDEQAQQKRYGGSSSSQSSQQWQAQQRGNSGPLLEQEVVENVLFMIGRRGLTTEIGLPLLEKLKRRHFAISENVIAGMMRGAAGGEEKASLPPQQRSEGEAAPRSPPANNDAEGGDSFPKKSGSFLQRRRMSSEQQRERLE